MKKLLNKPAVRYVLVLVVGVAIGALFYPTKHIEERVKTEYQEKLDKQSEESSSKISELREKVSSLSEEKTKIKIESSQKITKLTYQVRELESKKKETFYKIIKPDGTIEEKRYTESEVSETSKVVVKVREEFDRKVTEISERWQRVHKSRVQKLKEEFDKKERDYQARISKMESEKIVDINPKRYGIEAGYTNDNTYYGHVTADVFGPVFIGLHTSVGDDDQRFGAGIGIRF